MAMTDIDQAERLTRRRARGAIVLGIFFLMSMATSLGVEAPLSRPQTFKLAAWIVWAAALCLLLAFGGGWLRRANVRALMNDETTRANRQRALVAGYWATVLSAFALYGINQWAPFGTSEAIRLLLSAAVGAATIRFGILEQRSLRGG